MKRLLFTFKLLAVLLVVDACLKCKDDPLPFYDFNSLAFYYSADGIKDVKVGTEFTFIVNLAGLEYMANSGRDLDIIPSAVAREECPSDGYRGVKFLVDSINIKSLEDWDVDHPAGTSLNDLTYFKPLYATWEDYELLSDTSSFSLIKEKGCSFQIKTSPTEDLKHVFQLTYYKSNGEIVEGILDTITWIK